MILRARRKRWSPQTGYAAPAYDPISGFTVYSYQTRSAVTTVPNAEWPATGEGVQVKRMTTVAQSPSEFGSGIWFGYNGIPFAGPQITWKNSEIGVSGSPLVSWPNSNGGTQSYPDDGTKVLVMYFDQSTELDGFNLHS